MGRGMEAKMQLGFSAVGVAFLLVLFIPNIRWAKRQPAGYEELQKHEGRVLLVLERAGQALTTCTSLIFVCPEGASFPWILVLVAASFSWFSTRLPGPAISGMERGLMGCIGLWGLSPCP